MVHQPAGEDWETYVIHSNDGTVPWGASPSNSKALALRVVACLGVVLGLAVIFWSFCCCCGAKKGSHQAEQQAKTVEQARMARKVAQPEVEVTPWV
jgi:hypothetical protein